MSFSNKIKIGKSSNLRPTNNVSILPSNQISINMAQPDRVNNRNKQKINSQNKRRCNQVVLPYVVTGLNIDILRPDVLKGISVGEVTNTVDDGYHGINDPRGGTMDDDTLCSTCNHVNVTCVGHSQYIKLPKDEIFIPQIYMETVVRVLRCVCRNCSGLLVTEVYMQTAPGGSLLEYKGTERLKKLAEHCVKQSLTCQRYMPVNKKYGPFNSLNKALVDPDKLTINCIANKLYKITENTIQCTDKETKRRGQLTHRGMHDQEESTSELTPRDIFEILSYISDEDKVLMGFPIDFVLTDYITDKIPCIPPCARPQGSNDGEITVDPLSHFLSEIVKKIYIDYPKLTDESEKKLAIKNITYGIYSHLIDNSDETLKRNGDTVVIAIKDRIKGKKGVLRGKSMGKRVDFVERTVLNPDCNLRYGEISVPDLIRNELTIPEKVTPYNINKLQEMHDKGEIKTITLGPLRGEVYGGARVLINKSNRGEKDLSQLKIGDVVGRYGQDGDLCLFNRQPTLQKEGLKGNRMIYNKKRTNNIHMCDTVGYNADFDGDEGTVHVMQTVGARSEAKYLANAESCIGDSQKSKTMAGLTYNALSSAYLMTQTGMDKILKNNDGKIISDGNYELSPDEWEYVKFELSKDEIYLTEDEIREATDILTLRENFSTMQQRLAKHKIDPLSGRALFSYILPADFNYDGSKIEKKFNVVEYIDQEPTEEMLLKKNVKYELISTEEEINDAYYQTRKIENSTKYPPTKKKSSQVEKVIKLKSGWKKVTQHVLNFGVKVRDGILISGTLKKAHVGATHNSMVHYLWKNYGEIRTAAFLTDGTFLTDWFIYNYGFSIGIGDCMAPDPEAVKETVDEEMHNAELAIDSLGKPRPGITDIEKEYREQQIRDFTDTAGAIGKRISSEQLPYNNPLNIMSDSGAKGNSNNTAQIVGLVGQQFIRRRRPAPTISGNTRCLPYFAPNSRRLEARGMIHQSFMKGISPAGAFYHMCASRIGLIGTSISTADTGALHRRISKSLENTIATYDGSIRTSSGAIFQMSCLDGFESAQSIPTTHPGMGTIYSFLDVKDIVNSLNYFMKQRFKELNLI